MASGVRARIHPLPCLICSFSSSDILWAERAQSPDYGVRKSAMYETGRRKSGRVGALCHDACSLRSGPVTSAGCLGKSLGTAAACMP